jgi:hypothetical protein
MSNLQKDNSTRKLTSLFEQKIKEANEPSGKKERVWTPHADDAYHKQTKLQIAQGPPPPKRIHDLP